MNKKRSAICAIIGSKRSFFLPADSVTLGPVWNTQRHFTAGLLATFNFNIVVFGF